MKRAKAREMIDSLMNTGFNNAIIFFNSSITNEIDSRDMLSTSYAEVTMWAQQVELFYREQNVSYVIYVNDEVFGYSSEPLNMEN